jgi:GDP-L-fucose synthase
MSSNILVTGGSGLVGRCFESARFIKTESRKSLDLLEKEKISNALSIIKPEGVIHCAAKVGGVNGNMQYPADFTYQNLMMNTNIIEESRKTGINKLISFASTCVFPDNVEYPLTPDKIHLGPPHQSNYGYAYSKRMAEIQIQAYREQYGVNYFSVIPCNIYGPGDNYDLDNGHVIPSLIHKFFIASELGEDVIIWGSGSPLREFIFSKDVAKLTELLYDNYTDGIPVILSSGTEISIKDLAYLIAEISDFKGGIKFDTNKPEGQFRKPSDNSAIKNMFSNFTFTPIEDGLRESIEWFKNNYPNLRK